MSITNTNAAPDTTQGQILAPVISKDQAVPVSTTNDDDESEESMYVYGVKLYMILFAIYISLFLVALDVSVISTMIPAITARFHSTQDIGWYGAAYPLALCSIQPLAGKIATLFSLKWTFLSFFLVFMLGSVLCGASLSSNMFITGRAVAGAGASGIFSGGIAIIAVIAPIHKRALYTGFAMSLFGVAAMCGPLVGGALTSESSWRWAFYLNEPCGAVTLAGLFLFFRPPPRKSEKGLTVWQKIGQLDLVGSGLFMPAIIMVLLALQWGGNEHAWKSATIIGLFCGFGGTITLFFLWEYHKGDEAMIPFSVFNRTVILSCVYSFFFLSSYVLAIYYIPEWFQIIKGASPLHSGVMQIPAVLSQIIGSGLSGVIASRTGWYNPYFFIGSAILCVASGLYTTLTPFSTPHRLWMPYEVLQGLGGGMPMQMPLLAVQTVLAGDQQRTAIATSLVVFFQYFGSSIMLSIGATVFQDKLISALKSEAGLNQEDVELFLLGGSSRVRQVSEQYFPGKLDLVLSAYNTAITKVFYVAVATTIMTFIAATGIEWKNMKRKSVNEDEESTKASQKEVANTREGTPEVSS